jgi:hypothetical protein
MIKGVKIDDTGALEAITKKAQAAMRRADGVTIEVVAGGRRGAAENTRIAVRQAELGRDPFYVAKDVRKEIAKVAPGVMSPVPAVVRKALTLMQDLLLVGIHRNVERQRNADGTPFTPLTAPYAKWKLRRFGFVRPILRATGDFLDGLRTRVKKVAG